MAQDNKPTSQDIAHDIEQAQQLTEEQYKHMLTFVLATFAKEKVGYNDILNICTDVIITCFIQYNAQIATQEKSIEQLQELAAKGILDAYLPDFMRSVDILAKGGYYVADTNTHTTLHNPAAQNRNLH